jgi:hypothetical protein
VKHSIIPAAAAGPASEPLPVLTRLARTLLLHQLRKVRYGRLRLIAGAIDETFGAVSEAAPFDVTIRVEERQLGDVQMLLTKPRLRRASLAVVNAAPA